MKTAIVTGAGTGIGRASAIALARAGFRVVLVGRREGPLREVATTIGEAAIVAAADVTSESDVARVFSQLDRLDMLFNNAGINIPSTPIEDLTFDQWKSVIDINMTGSFLCAREAFRVMKSQSPMGGRIINNGSISAHVPRLNAVPYTASKHAITGLTRALSLEGRAYNIACGQIDVGNATSEMTAVMTGGSIQADGSMKVEPIIDVQHVAEAVVYMASLPLEANVQFMTVMASSMPYIGRG